MSKAIKPMTTLNNRTAQGLTGTDLLNRVKELGDIDAADLARACGYVTTNEDGTQKLEFKRMYTALLEAKGLEINYDKLNQEIVFAEFTRGEVDEWWQTNKPDFKAFGNRSLDAVKWVTIQMLEVLRAYHRINARNSNLDEEQRGYWDEDAKRLDDIIARTQGIQLGEDDKQFQPYEEKHKVDSYLSGISDDSLEVLEHFGAEAPKLLNDYSCALEDALINQVELTQKLQAELAVLKGESAAEPDGSEELKQIKARLNEAIRK